MGVKLAWRLFRHELARGDLWVIAFSLMLTVFSVVSLTAITESVRQALSQRTAQLSAADLVLRSSRPVEERILTLATDEGLQSSRQTQFNTMVFAGDEQMQLTSIKVVDSNYPLRGTLQLSKADLTRQSQLLEGQVFVEARLLAMLKVQVGDVIDIGQWQTRIAGLIEAEPDAPLNLFGGLPRVLMHQANLASTGVIQPGSQVSYRYLFAGTESQLQQFKQSATPILTGNDRWQDADRQNMLGAAIDRAERFLLLAGLLGVLLACCAAAVAANRYSQRHRQSIAIFKAIGLSRTQLRAVFLSNLVILVLFSFVMGLLLAGAAVQLTHSVMQSWIADYQPSWSWRPVQLGALTALITIVFFSGRPVWLMASTPALEVLRPGEEPVRVDLWHLGLGGLATLGLLWFFSRDLWLSVVLFVGCTALAGLIMALSYGVLRLTKPVKVGHSGAFALALSSLRRRVWANGLQLVTFTLALFLALLLYFLRTELIGQWQQQLPQGAPNYFLVNIDPQERPAIASFFAETKLPAGPFYPMLAGRVTAVNKEPLVEPEAADKPENAGKRIGFGRELNLSWGTQLPAGNQVIQGQWFTSESRAGVSVEAKQAERLRLAIGDSIDFEIGGFQLTATVQSIRQVDWNQLQPNFFMILSPDLMQDLPSTEITAIHIPDDKSQVMVDFSRRWPTVSQISVGQIINQVQQVISQVSTALSFVLLIISLAAVLVLLAQVQASIEQRKKELAILRTLGATSRLLRRAVVYEFLISGALAGALATLLAESVLLSVQARLFNLAFSWHPELWLLGPCVGALVVAILGFAMLRHVMVPSPAQVIRQALAES